MSRSVRITTMTILAVLLGVATMLATISGAVGAIDWATRTFGNLAVYVVAAFLAGCIVTHSVHRGVAAGADAVNAGGETGNSRSPKWRR